MKATRDFIKQLGFPSGDSYPLKSTDKRFPDGAQYRFEIPSVEGPRCLKAVIDEARRYRLTLHRVSQGSGIMLMTDDEIKEMLKMARDQQMEVSLFVGPRATFDIGAQPLTAAGKNIGLGLRGMDQVVYAVEDIKRGCELGLRGILVADLGLLWLVNQLKKSGQLPANLVVKISVQLSATNPVSVKILEDFGGNTFNVSSDLPLPLLAAIREAVSLPLDLYVETPDNFGGFVRHSGTLQAGTSQRPRYLSQRNSYRIHRHCSFQGTSTPGPNCGRPDSALLPGGVHVAAGRSRPGHPGDLRVASGRGG